ncbi:acetyl-CoA carboxylase biotin carboxyl carrier protein [Acholeplasma granularum]|uniref:acetyl-CoA carboxylase biotin carboxyl carrier protein n=1 Tax=Acholeplasma granularum TaxID=264635 RepID=UPI000472DB51|nr:acetyl-CoA carboxylase biotin carboxyl carrier protein [Acholeplasma granularum]
MKLNEIKSIIKDFESSTLTVLDLETEHVKLRLSKNKDEKVEVINQTVHNQNKENIEIKDTKPSIETHITSNDLLIKSPLVGTFYSAASPDSEPFVKVGDTVKKGQVVCIVEAMKIMNEITSLVDGKITKVNFKNGDVVGFDDVLFSVVE